MRLLRITTLGGLTAIAAFALSTTGEGALGAGAMILAMFVAVTTAGLAAAAAVDRWIDRPVVNPVLAAQAEAARCSNCGSHRKSMAGMWACPRCDLRPV